MRQSNCLNNRVTLFADFVKDKVLNITAKTKRLLLCFSCIFIKVLIIMFFVSNFISNNIIGLACNTNKRFSAIG